LVIARVASGQTGHFMISSFSTEMAKGLIRSRLSSLRRAER
jgi:hypothetical protein